MKTLGIILMLTTSLSFATETSGDQQPAKTKSAKQEFAECVRSIASQDDIDALSAMDDVTKEIYLNQMREFVNAELEDRYKSIICISAKRANYEQYTNTIDAVKERVNNSEISNLSYAEVSYYVDCDEKHNPFYVNIDPNEIQYTAEGLTETTLEMIRSLGPLLLAKGPDGRTPLEHVQAKLTYAEAHSNETVQGVYSSIKSTIELEIINLRMREDQQVAQR